MLCHVSITTIKNICVVCQKSAFQKCGGCHQIFYCSRDHQRSDWKKHKKVCRVFEVRTDDVFGRHLIAIKDIKPGEIVLQEPPLIWGPSQVTAPVCLGCGKALTEKNSCPCSKCGWPVCNETCEKSPAHLPECRFTISRGEKVCIKNFGIIHPSYQCITVLRCLYQKQYLPEIWGKLDKLQSHCEERRSTNKYESERIHIAKFILRFFKLSSVFTEEEILRICGIVTVNAHEVPLSNPAFVAIYENTSMLEHSCRANCNKTFTNDGRVLIKSGSFIKKGEHLNICYTDPLWGTANRRYHLYESKYFWCGCYRCEDPTEFGTYFSAIRCQIGGCKGHLLPDTFVENYQKVKGVEWICNTCHNTMSSYCVQDLIDRIGSDLSDIEKGSSKACKEFIEKYVKYLHQNHFYLTDVKLALAQILGHEQTGGLPALSDADLYLKAKLCQSLVDLLKTLIPGETRARGVVLFELHATIAEMGRRRATMEGDPDLLNAALLEAKKKLTEATELLKLEPEKLPEGKIYKECLRNLREIEVVLRTVHKALGDSPG